MAYKRKKDGIYYDKKTGRLMEHCGLATRIYWSAQMLSDLRRLFPTTLNEELAACLGMSVRAMVRKAHELGIRKDPKWLSDVFSERRELARSVYRLKGRPGCFRKGVHTSTEFKKGRRPTEEQELRRRESLKAWYRTHPAEASAKARKIWETRRKSEVRL